MLGDWELDTQVNFSGHEFVFANIERLLQNHLAAKLKVILVRDWGKIAPGKAREPSSVRARYSMLFWLA